MRVLIIDNYDSFTYNLYQILGEILSSRSAGGEFHIAVKRNDQITFDEAKNFGADRIVISPGPGTPDDPNYFGVCSDIITRLGPECPLLGVCLGMQGIAHCFGARVVHAPLPMHGKTSTLSHDGAGVFTALPQGVEVMRYHSLAVDPASVPDCLQVTSLVGADESERQSAFDATNPDQTEIMGLRHREYPIEGIQFHPESFATEGGRLLLENFLS
ncbi:MAG: aminodeoxychorismate/anthranilate synthase component II [Gammaproteobacteria bacterium]|nr:aminodeoxychorismate/anthranilate synthase component II [Gammaproteobacteria bacterium]